MTRLAITKTPKCYVGGAFIRSESGRVFPLNDAAGAFIANIPQCTRKDVRNAVEAAAKAGPAWAKRTPYNRGQILYRLAEMLESRAAEMAEALGVSGAPQADAMTRKGVAARKIASAAHGGAQPEVAAACDRLLYFAGWADKYEQVMGNTNAVASSHFNFTVCEPMGVIGVIAGEAAPLLGLVSQLAAIIVSGNTAVAHVSETRPMPAILLGEILAVSDLPGGVVNLLTGIRAEMLPTFATHAHLRGLDVVVNNNEEKKTLGIGAADSVKRVKYRDAATLDWTTSDAHESAYAIRDFLEFKTTWHPIGA